MRLSALAAATGLTLLVGCEGTIASRGPAPATTGSAGTGGSVTGAGGGQSGSPAMSDPGRVTLHRLNNTEYDNTVRDAKTPARRP
jgi:hypothetical protein